MQAHNDFLQIESPSQVRALRLILENLALMRNCTISAKDINQQLWTFAARNVSSLFSFPFGVSVPRERGKWRGYKDYWGRERQLYNCYKGSQIALNTLNINVLYVFKGSRRLHINCRLLCVTCWYTVSCACCKVHTKGSRFVVSPCEPFVNP